MAKKNPLQKWKKYREATSGPIWAAFRKRMFELRGERCEQCYALSNPEAGIYLHIHHKHYNTVGREQPEDVEILCNVCHGRHHGREVIPKRGKWKLPKEKVAKRTKRRLKRAKPGRPWSKQERERLLAEAEQLLKLKAGKAQ